MLRSRHLALSSITILSATDFEDAVVCNQSGCSYEHDALQVPSESVDTFGIHEFD